MFPAFYVLGLWLLDFTSQFAPDSPVKARLFLIFFVVPVKGNEGRPEGCGTVTDMPHPSIHSGGNIEGALRNVYMKTSAHYDNRAAITFKYDLNLPDT